MGDGLRSYIDYPYYPGVAHTRTWSSANGLTSNMVQSLFTNTWYSALICSAAAALSPVTASPSTTCARSSSGGGG
jgi:hypothetical protein